MKIICKNCSQEISAENINVNQLIAKCDKCNTVFKFQDQFEEPAPASKFNLDDLPLPPSIQVKHESGFLQIERKWPRLIGFVLSGFALMWNGMLWIGFVPTMLMASEGFLILMLLPFIAIGIIIAYSGLANILNTTFIRIDGRNLTISHAPLPYKSLKLDVQDITQLFTRQKIYQGKNGTTVSYELLAINSKNREINLLSNIESPEVCLYLEKEIEGYLAIHDMPVPGEYGK